eukprot:4570759-Pyramimonas_sp.AAC.1
MDAGLERAHLAVPAIPPAPSVAGQVSTGPGLKSAQKGRFVCLNLPRERVDSPEITWNSPADGGQHGRASPVQTSGLQN